MNISSVKKLFAGVSAVAISLTSVGSVFAAYSDVPAGVWYEEAVDAFTDAGYLDANQTRFRGGDNANRAEFVKLVVELNGGILSTPPAVPSFDDVKPGAWYYSYMEEAAKEGWVKGDRDCYGSHPCNARPSANINRAEAAALIVRAFELEATEEAPAFVDVASSQWYSDVVQTAADHCVLQGDDATGRVRPADPMNRAEMVVMLNRVDQGLTFGVDCGTEGPAAEAALQDVAATDAVTLEVEFTVAVDEEAAADAGKYAVSGAADIDIENVEVITEDTVELTLADSMEAGASYTLSVEDMATADGDTFSDTMDFEGFTEVVKGDGTLEVSLASTNPEADAVPRGAVGVVMASLDLTASCDDDVTLSEITVLHEGFGTSADIDGVYASIDGGRVTRKRTIDSEDQTADLRFSQELTVPACGTKTVDIVADFNSTATVSGEHNFAVELPTDFQSNAQDVEGNFPLRGNSFRIAAVTSGKVTVTYRTVTPNEVDIGDTAKVVGKFEVAANSVEDQTIYSVTLEQNGSASDADIANVFIRRTDGTVLTNKASGPSGDYVTLVFDPPFTVLEGDNITLEVVADVVGGAADTIIMQFEETSDLFAVGSLYGYGVNGQLYGSQVATSGTATTVTIQAGEFTVEVDGPVQQKYTRDDNDAILAKINLIAAGDEPLDVKDLFIAIEAETSTGAGLQANYAGGTSYDNVHEVLEDVELRNTKTGQTISGVRLTSTNTTNGDFFTSATETFQTYRFDDFVIKGSTTWELRVDFIDNGAGIHPLSGDRFLAHVCTNVGTTNTCDMGGMITAVTTYNMVVEGVSSGDPVTDVRPGGTITGNRHRIAAPELNVAVKATGTSDTAVKNSKNINLLRFEARAGEAEDVLFTSAVFQAADGSLLNAQNYALWVDTDGDSAVDTVLEKGVASQSSAVTFSELAGGGYVVPAQESVIFEVHGDVAANLQSDTQLQMRFSTGSTTTFLAAEEVDDGSNLSGIKLNGSFHNSVTSADIIVTTADSKLWSFVSQGDLFVTKDSTPVRSRQLLAGTLGDPVLRLNFRAQNEDIDVTDLQLVSSGSTAASIDRLELYKEGETTAFATATVGACGTDDVLTVNSGMAGASIQTFCANMESRQLVVKDGENQDVIVRARLKTDAQGATVSEDIAIWVPGTYIAGSQVINDTSGSGAVRARGLESSNNLVTNDDDQTADGEVFIGTDAVTSSGSSVVGNRNDVVLAKITSIVNASPDADNTSIPTGVNSIGQFRFTAATNNNSLNGLNKAVLSGVIFTVVGTNVDFNGSNFKFYNKADTSNKQACTMLGTTGNSGSLTVECKGLVAASVDTSISSGESVTFVLEADITNPDATAANSSNLQVSIQDFSDLTQVDEAPKFGSSNSHIQWQDTDTTATNFYWIEYSETAVRSTSYKS